MATKKAKTEKVTKPAKQKKVKPVKVWSINAIKKADEITKYSKEKLGGNTHENHVTACLELFGVRYMDNSMHEVRQRLSFLGGTNSHKTIGAKQLPKDLHEEEWWKELSSSKSMQHGLHPDEANLIGLLNQE